MNDFDLTGQDLCPVVKGCHCRQGYSPLHPEVDLAQTWCDKCDQPATRGIQLTNGTHAFRCSLHAWAILPPRGRSRIVESEAELREAYGK